MSTPAPTAIVTVSLRHRRHPSPHRTLNTLYCILPVRRRWRVRVWLPGCGSRPPRRLHVGSFASLWEAQRARDAALRRYLAAPP